MIARAVTTLCARALQRGVLTPSKANALQAIDRLGQEDARAWPALRGTLLAPIERLHEITGPIGGSVDQVEAAARLLRDAGTTMTEIVARCQLDHA